MLSLRQELTIDRLGQRGEGIAQTPEGNVFVPYALPGERVIAEVDGERGKLVDVARPSAERIAPFCPVYGICGGCAVQALAAPAYDEWKRGLLVDALSHVGLTPMIERIVDAHGAGRRRATFHARFDRDPLGRMKMEVGFMRARAHEIVDLDACPILSPEMAGALPAAHAIARLLSSLLKPLDIVVTATLEGLDIDFRGTGALPFEVSRKLISIAQKLDVARISNHGETVIERRQPLLKMGNASVLPPPGAFLQATLAGEETLSGLVVAAVGDAKKVADLFAGVGTFALRLCARAEVHAVESEALSLAAITRAVNNTPGSRQVTTERRDLVRRPLAGAELAVFDAVVFDPPRAGAQTQAEALAKILVDGGYTFERAMPVDQFRHSPHVEIVGVFRRVKTKTRKPRRLLG
jgi:23S rRNA (uracil1939-C5)-methyltransferase